MHLSIMVSRREFIIVPVSVESSGDHHNTGKCGVIRESLLIPISVGSNGCPSQGVRGEKPVLLVSEAHLMGIYDAGIGLYLHYSCPTRVLMPTCLAVSITSTFSSFSCPMQRTVSAESQSLCMQVTSRVAKPAGKAPPIAASNKVAEQR